MRANHRQVRLERSGQSTDSTGKRKWSGESETLSVMCNCAVLVLKYQSARCLVCIWLPSTPPEHIHQVQKKVTKAKLLDLSEHGP